MSKQPVLPSEEAYFSLQEENQKLAKINTELQQQNAFLEQELAQLKRMLFGAKRERFIPTDPGQLPLALDGVKQVAPEPGKEQVTYQREKPKKKGKAIRLALPAHLPREQVILEPVALPEGARKIGQEVTEFMDYLPGKLFVRQLVRPKYVAPVPGDDAMEQVLISSLPSLPIPQGNAGPGLLAHLLISKFVDHLPFYRQVQQFQREGVKIAESTISGWFTKSCQLLEPLYEALKERVQQSGYLQADETPIPVQSSHKKGAIHKGYHWVYRSPVENMVCFDYQVSRGREGPVAFLNPFKGALQTDGYTAYESFAGNKDITLLACMAHARRYFEQALENDTPRATYVLQLMQRLYAIERKAKNENLSAEERHGLRQEEAIPFLEELHEWLKDNLGEVLPKSAIGKAIAYSLKLWPRLIRYTENGQWAIDNKGVENSIRPVALGRKNYLFAGSHQAAHHAAMMYSFLGTCKMNGIEPFGWLREVLWKIPDTKLSQLHRLLPIKDNLKKGKPQ